MWYDLVNCIDLVWTKFWWELSCFFMGVWFMAVMDYFNFQVPYNSHSFWSLHTHGSKFEIWHVSKRIALLFFAMAAMGYEYTLYTLTIIVYSPFVWMAVLAWVGQKFYHLLKVLIKKKPIGYDYHD